MAGLTRRLWVRLASVVLGINLVLLPLLYLGVSAIVREGYAELFVSRARTYSRLLADELELLGDADFERHAADLLDALALSGQVQSAELVDGSRLIRHSGVTQDPRPARTEDFSFGGQRDQTYFISQAVNRSGRALKLHIGFDEGPTLDRIGRASERLIAALIGFALASFALAIALSAMVARPLVRLQDAARRVAAGSFHAPLEVDSSIHEVRELNAHLERMRSELVGVNERLQRVIAEREASERKRTQLERQLRHRERIATVGTLAGGIAHEFNNIMTPILLYAQLAHRGAPPGSALDQDLRRIVQAAHRARSLVTRILTFSRKMDTQDEQVFAVKPVLDEALALIRATAGTNIEVETGEIDPGIRVRGDPGALTQVMVNLLTNACQAMRASGGVLAVRLVAAAPEDGGAGQLVLHVRDTGHGMPAQVLEHVFEPFFTTREVGEGTGLGLSVAHGIVESMGGRIEVESTPGEGTEFLVYLPIAEPSDQATADV